MFSRIFIERPRLAMVVSIAALAAILGTLFSSLLPLYVGHYDLDHLSQ